MRILVFGGSGFVGSHVADALTASGHEVTIFDSRPSPYLQPVQRFIRGDMLDAKAVQQAVAGHEVVYNFAGMADIEDAQKRPVDTVRLNVLSNVHALEAAHLEKVDRYVFASTVYVYSDTGGFYRCSKQACELYIEEFQQHHGLAFTIVRYGSLYGRRADERNSVYHYLSQGLVERRIVGYGSGDEIREYIHAADAARASVEILAPEFANQHVILTGHQPMRVRDLLQMIREIVGSDVKIEYAPLNGNLAQDRAHYASTPYTFRPKVAKKLVSHYYLDLGQGLLDCLHEIYEKFAMAGPPDRPAR